jgi:hypothetical protein
MASLNGGNASQQKTYHAQTEKTFISTQAFNTKLFTYSTSLDQQFVTVGSLVANANATASNCPANRVLHANGRQLLPGVHPNITKPYQGVYDPVSGLNGFIDATDPAFAIYQVNMPHQYDLGISSPIATLGGQGANLRAAIDSGRVVQAAENGSINVVDSSVGEFALFTTGTGRTSTITIQSSQVIPGSRIFLTQTVGAFSTLTQGLPAVPTVSTVTTGSFQVVFPAPLYQNDVRSYNFVVM